MDLHRTCRARRDLWRAPFTGRRTAADPDSTGQLVEDCAVCCQPWAVTIERDGGKLRVQVTRAQ